MQTVATRADKQCMPGTLHQGILELLREDPWLPFDILGIPRPVDGTPTPTRAEIERDGQEPLTVQQGYPDLVLLYSTPVPEGAQPLRGPKRGIVIAVEAQKDYDAEKRWLIPVYQTHLAAEHRLETWVVVVSLDEQQSRSLRLWKEGGPPKVDALVLDVESVPKSPWLDEPAPRPTAAVLAGALHGYAGDFEAARIAFRITRTMDKKSRRRHGMTILAALPKDQRERLIGELPVQEQHSWMDVERRSGTYHFGVEEGLAQGREHERATLIALIFKLLGQRDVIVDAEAEAQIRGCDDLSTLQQWVLRAAHATSTAELLAS